MNLITSFIPIAVSCIMPIMIVWLITRMTLKKSEYKMNVIIKAIENGADIDPDMLMAVNSKHASTRMALVKRLGAGVAFAFLGLVFVLGTAFGLAAFSAWGYYTGFPLLAVGLGLLVSFFFGMNFLKSDIEAEEGR